MKISVFFACLVCRLVRAFARLVHRGGTAMPGRIALKLCPGLLRTLAGGVDTVAITGTNSKTTSARMVEEAFREAGRDYFANRSGANLISGITTEFVLNATLSGRPKEICRHRMRRGCCAAGVWRAAAPNRSCDKFIP